MDFTKEKYIIVELIPTSSKKETGDIIQLSALKLDGITLLDRFDYRLEDQYIESKDLKEMIQYDKKSFNYVKDSNMILRKFQKWAKDYPLFIIEENYTRDYLRELDNKKECIFPHLELENSQNVFEKLIQKYHLEPSNHLVDLIYEAIIFKSNE